MSKGRSGERWAEVSGCAKGNMENHKCPSFAKSQSKTERLQGVVTGEFGEKGGTQTVRGGAFHNEFR